MTDDPAPTADPRLETRKSIRNAILIAGTQIVGALLLTFANQQGLIDDDTTVRGVMVLIGLLLVGIGNALPKRQEGPALQSVGQAMARQSILRVGGWAVTLSGLAWVVLWIVAPRDVATPGSIAVVATAGAVTIAYAVWRYRRFKSTSA